MKYIGSSERMISPIAKKYDSHVCFFKVLAFSGQLGTCVTVVCHVFDFVVVLGRGESSFSVGVEPRRNCRSGCPRELVFMSIVANARSQKMQHQTNETKASIRTERTQDF